VTPPFNEFIVDILDKPVIIDGYIYIVPFYIVYVALIVLRSHPLGAAYDIYANDD